VVVGHFATPQAADSDFFVAANDADLEEFKVLVFSCFSVLFCHRFFVQFVQVVGSGKKGITLHVKVGAFCSVVVSNLFLFFRVWLQLSIPKERILLVGPLRTVFLWWTRLEDTTLLATPSSESRCISSLLSPLTLPRTSWLPTLQPLLPNTAMSPFPGLTL
jgi:hypothetical protein